MSDRAGKNPPQPHAGEVRTYPKAPYIADVGFGAWALSGPLKLLGPGEQDTPHGPARVTPVGDYF